MSNWQPIETAPKDGSNIILGCPTYVDAGYWEAEGWTLYPDDTAPESDYCQRFTPAPTHWQPLPEPPWPGFQPYPGPESPK